MRQFTCKIRLNGSLYNEVTKVNVTVPEIIVLRAIHGADSVSEIKEVDPIQRDEDERARIDRLYGLAIGRRKESIPNGLAGLLGFPGSPLPDAAPGVPPPEARKRKGKADLPPPPETGDEALLEA